MRIRPADSLTEDLEILALADGERTIDRMESVIRHFREQQTSLLQSAYLEVEKLREAMPTPPAMPDRPPDWGHDRREHQIEQHVRHWIEERLKALDASLQGRVADLVCTELAGPNAQAVIRQVVDLRLKAVTEAISRINGGDAEPKYENRRRRSRRFR